jgi:hypothetical protein
MVMPVPLAILTVWSGLLLVIVKVPLLELTPIPVPAMMPTTGRVTPEPLVMPNDWPLSVRLCSSFDVLPSTSVLVIVKLG